MKYLMMCLTLLFTGACATGFSGNETSVIIDSSPSGQKFSVTNAKGKVVHQGVTPETVMLDTSAGFFEPAQHSLKVGKQAVPLKAEMSAFYFGNVFNLVGFVVDPFTGAMWNLPDVVTVSGKDVDAQFSPDTVK